jgi:hypothetical protein
MSLLYTIGIYLSIGFFKKSEKIFSEGVLNLKYLPEPNGAGRPKMKD